MFGCIRASHPVIFQHGFPAVKFWLLFMKQVHMVVSLEVLTVWHCVCTCVTVSVAADFNSICTCHTSKLGSLRDLQYQPCAVCLRKEWTLTDHMCCTAGKLATAHVQSSIHIAVMLTGHERTKIILEPKTCNLGYMRQVICIYLHCNCDFSAISEKKSCSAARKFSGHD